MRSLASIIASTPPIAASRARWLVTASRTGRGGKAAPALLKWRTLATPGVSDLSSGTSSVILMPASLQARDGKDATHGPAPPVKSAARAFDAACEIQPLATLRIEIRRVEPALERCLQRRPFAVED